MPHFKQLAYDLGGAPIRGQLPLFVNAKDATQRPKYYFVDSNNGSSGASGESPDQAISTIAEAISKVNGRINWSDSPWANNDVIVISPGDYDENLTSLPYGATMIGLGHDTRDGQNGVVINASAGSPVQVASIVNSTFINIGFVAADGETDSYAFDGGIVNNCQFYNCFFSGNAEAATIAAAFYTCDSVKSTWKNCWFCNADRGFMANYEDGGDSFSYALLEDCIFSGIDTAGMYISLNLVGPHSFMRRCDFAGAGQTMALGLDDNVDILNCSFCTFEATANDPASGAGKYNGCYLNGALIT